MSLLAWRPDEQRSWNERCHAASASKLASPCRADPRALRLLQPTTPRES